MLYNSCTSFQRGKHPQTHFRAPDAVLTGFAGVVLTTANPSFWIFFLLAAFGTELLLPYLLALMLSGLAFGVIVPGAVMWWLTVKRTKSHDPYDLFLPPLASFVLLLFLLISMQLLEVQVTARINTPTTVYPNGGSYASMQLSLSLFLLIGLVLSFVGVTIAEAGSKVRKKITT